MSTPAGWYPDPEMTGTQRYWNGAAWTDHRAPAAVNAASVQSSSNVVAFGYLAALFMPIVGFIIGLTQINRGSDGLRIVGLSLAAALVWTWVLVR